MSNKTIINRQPINVGSKGVEITRGERDITIRIPIDIAKSAGAYDISKIVIAAVCPLFLNSNKEQLTAPVPISSKRIIKETIPEGDRFLDVGIVMESVGHYTGGRYYISMLASVLSQYANVTLYTNKKPIFPDGLENSFSSLKVIVSPDMGFNNEKNTHDVIVGSPVNGGRIADEYSNKWNIPCYQIIFETPNWIKEFRDGEDGNEEYWKGYQRILKDADKVICISREGAKYAEEWAMISPDRIHVIYPSINTPAADRVIAEHPKEEKTDTKLTICCSHRFVHFKNPVAIIKKLSPKKFRFVMIGKQTENFKKGVEQLKAAGYEILTRENIDDSTKFLYIRTSDILLFPTGFEGFGMPPAEALYCGTAVFTTDLPVLKEVYGSSAGIRFLPKGNVKAMVDALNKEYEDRETINEALRNFIAQRACSIHRFKDDILRTFEIPKLSVGVIAYNIGEYISYAIRGVVGIADQIIVVEGAVRGYVGNSEDGTSSDNTASSVLELMKDDYLGKITLIQIPEGRSVWESKVEMQNEIAKLISGDVYLKLDADEIWKPEFLVGAVRYILHEKADILCIPFLHFWLNFQTLAVDDGGKWSTNPPRIWKWRKGMKHTSSFNFFLSPDGKKMQAPEFKVLTYRAGEEAIYHFGYVRKLSTLQEKIRYYKTRGIEKVAKDTVTGWKEGMPTQPTQSVPSTTKEFTGELPEIMKNHPYAKIRDIRELN